MRVFLSAVLALAVMVVTTAAPASARAFQCKVVIVSVTANDIQEDGAGHDDIWVKVANSWFPTYLRSTPINEGQTLLASQLNNPQATKPSVTVSIVEDDTWPNPNDTLGSFTEDCVDVEPPPGGGDFVTIGSNGVSYTINYFGFRV